MLNQYQYAAVILLVFQSVNLGADTQTAKQEANGQKIYGGFTTGYGYESNPLFMESEQPLDQGDNYLESFAYVYVPLSKKLYAVGKLYVRDYDELNKIDYKQYTLSMQYHAKFADWQLIPAIEITNSEYGGDDYQSIDKYSLQVNRKLNRRASVRFLYEYSDFTSENTAYDYLAGERNRVRFDYRVKTALGKIRLRYQLDVNDRVDLATADYSPTRNTFSARIIRSVAGWKLGAKVEYRNSEYDPTRSAGFVREDDRLKMGIDISRKLSRQWQLGLLYDYIDNESNVSEKNYDSNDYQLYVGWSF